LSFDQTEIIQGFKGKAVHDAGISDESYDFIICFCMKLSECQSDGSCNSGAGVSDDELVVYALVGVWETAYAVSLSEVCEIGFSACDDFVRITLMTDIPEQFVGFEIEDVVQGESQLDYAEVAGEVSAGFAYGTENELSDFICEVAKFIS